jgi:hypothetical protein
LRKIRFQNVCILWLLFIPRFWFICFILCSFVLPTKCELFHIIWGIEHCLVSALDSNCYSYPIPGPPIHILWITYSYPIQWWYLIFFILWSFSWFVLFLHLFHFLWFVCLGSFVWLSLLESKLTDGLDFLPCLETTIMINMNRIWMGYARNKNRIWTETKFWGYKTLLRKIRW